MKVIHFAENSKNIEVVELLAHQVSETNRLSVIQYDKLHMTKPGHIMMTGGHIMPYSDELLTLLMCIPLDKLYYFLLNVKTKAVGKDVKKYYEAHPTYKRGDIVKGNISLSNKTYADNPCITEDKLYAVLSDTEQKATGKFVKIIEDKGREMYVRVQHLKRTTDKLN